MGQKMKVGYCTWCANNTDHGKYASSPVAGLFHAVVRTFAGGNGYGPWYCSECRRVSATITPEVESQESGVTGGVADANRNGVVSLRPQITIAPVATPQSNSRFSPKYRFSVAKRVLSGQATFKQVSDELSVSKKEVWGWLTELHVENQQQINDLKRQVRSLEDLAGSKISHAEFGDATVSAAVKPEPSAATDLSQWSTILVSSQAATPLAVSKGNRSPGS